MPYTVIGVLPPTFAFVRNEALRAPQRIDAFITFALDLADPATATAGTIRRSSARAPGRRREAVAAAVDAAGRTIDARDFNGRGLKLYPVGLKADVVARARPALLVLGAAGALLALMLMVNLASVLLARAAQREHEFAVSRALGASDAAVMRATLFEGGLLGLAGGAPGALAAVWATRALVALAPLDLPRRDAIAVDWRIGVGMAALGMLLGLLAATVPADLGGARDAVVAAREQRRARRRRPRPPAARHDRRAGRALARAPQQRRARRAQRRAPAPRGSGIHAEGVLTFRVRSPPEFFPKPPDVVGFQDRVERALAAIPGRHGRERRVRTAADGGGVAGADHVPGRARQHRRAEHDAPLVDVIATRASYVQVMGMRIVAGRAFDPVRQDGRQEALIDRRLAEQFFPNGNPIGAKIPGPAPGSPELRGEACGRIHHRRRRRAGAALRRAPGRPPAALHPHRGLGLPAVVVRRAHRPRPRVDRPGGARGAAARGLRASRWAT